MEISSETIGNSSRQAICEKLNSESTRLLFEHNLEAIKQFILDKEDMARHLGIEYTKVQPGYIEATMPVDQRTCRICHPKNILNGGASLALAENVAGLGSLLLCPPKIHPCGIQVSANHVRMITIGHTVTAVGCLVHFGSSLHIWEITVLDEQHRELSSIKVTNMLIAEASED